MFILDWLFDKMGYTRKVYWADVFKNWEDSPKKVATKRKTVAKKSLKIQSAPTKGNFSKKQIQGAIKAARKKA